MTDLTPNHPAVEAMARAALAAGWTCDTHEPLLWGECPDCTGSHLRTARRALSAALPHLDAERDAYRAQVELRDKALEAVLDLHKPVQASMTALGGVRDITVCAHCLDPAWPCGTVTIIDTKLKGGA